MSLDSNTSNGIGAMAINAYPAKFSFNAYAANCSTDYVVYNTGLPGGAAQGTVVGYSNLYAGTCHGTVPTTAFSYNTGGTANLSPVLSMDGTEIAYIQTSGGVASLVIVHPSFTSGGTVDGPATIAEVTPADYAANCAGNGPPCYTTIAFSNSATDTNSSPFYLYDGTDTLYVGDDSGVLHQFTGVFLGTPAETTITDVWPATVDAGYVLTGPVFEPVSGNVFVGDSLECFPM